MTERKEEREERRMDAKRQKPQLRLQWREIIVGLKKRGNIRNRTWA